MSKKFRFICLAAVFVYLSGSAALAARNHIGSLPVSLSCHSQEAGQAETPTASITYNSGVYASKVSVVPGERIDFHVSSAPSRTTATFYREGPTRQLMGTASDVRGGTYGCSGKYATGCNWPVALSYTIPADWPSGVYTVDVPRANGGTMSGIFWVRADRPGSTSKVLFLSSVNTYHAYNGYGGGSLYKLAGRVIKSTKVSFDRPFVSGIGEFGRWERKFIAWAEANGYPLEYAATYDLAFHPELLDAYDVVIIAGHSEYWSWDMRERIKVFLDHGGRFMNLSGNTMWWQVRFEDNGRTMVAYKAWQKDPLNGQKVTTDLNMEYPINDTSAHITGLDYYYGGFPGKTRAGYKTVNADHWVFNGTGLRENEEFGRGPTLETSIHDKETDGMPFNCAADGSTIIGPLSNSGTPGNFAVLGIVPVNDKQKKMRSFGEMGLYTLRGGGAVFSAGTTGWALGLQDPVIDRITRNVLDRFISGNVPAEEAKPGTEYLLYDGFNCSAISRVRFGGGDADAQIHALNYYATVDTEADRLDAACGVDGSGLRIAAKRTQKGVHYQSHLFSDWRGTDTLYTRVNVDLSGMNLGSGAIINLFEQYADDQRNKPAAVAVLQITRENNVWLARYQPAGADLAWTEVPGERFFLLETTWDRRANQVGLWVDGRGGTQDINLQATPELNRSDFGVMSATGAVSGALCLDELVQDDQLPH